MSIDLSGFESDNEGEWLDVLNPVTGEVIVDDEGLAMRIKLVGKDSDEYRAAGRRAQERRLKSRSRKNRVSPEQLEAEALDVLVACTRDWQGVGEGGEELDCTPANVRRVYGRYIWLREQVDEFVDDRGNFMRG